MVRRFAEDGTTFTVASTTSRRSLRLWRRASIRAMFDAGITLSICDDDPGMFPRTVNTEYGIAHDEIGLTPEELAQIVMNSWRASWLAPDELAPRIADVASRIDHAPA